MKFIIRMPNNPHGSPELRSHCSFVVNCNRQAALYGVCCSVSSNASAMLNVRLITIDVVCAPDDALIANYADF